MLKFLKGWAGEFAWWFACNPSGWKTGQNLWSKLTSHTSQSHELHVQQETVPQFIKWRVTEEDTSTSGSTHTGA